MKNVYAFFLLFLTGLGCVNAQYVAIPDTNFRLFLQAIPDYAPCFNAQGELDTTCAGNVVNTQLHFPLGPGISNIQGIEYLDNLDSIFLNSELTSLAPLPKGLISLSINYTYLTSLPPLPNGIKYLSCSLNPYLQTISSLPDSLIIADLSQNQLISLPTLPSKLKSLWCHTNQLLYLPSLPSGLTELVCPLNFINNLPPLPNSLLTLGCSQNQLSSLPTLPNNLSSLSCDNNLITSLPSLPLTIKYLEFGDNLVTHLPLLPNGLTTLSGISNNLTILPPLPDSLNTLYVGHNPYLACLPILPQVLLYLYTDSTAITCIPNLPPNLATTLPICTNSNQICSTNPMASGKVYLDANSNNIFDSTEMLINNWIVKTAPNNWVTNSNDINGYYVALDSGVTNMVSLTNAFPNAASISPPSYSITPTSNGLVGSNYDFPVHLIPNITDVSVSLAHQRARPGFATSATFSVHNLGSTAPLSDVKLLKPAGWNVLQTNPIASNIVGDTIIWQGLSLNLFENKTFQAHLQVPIPTITPIGSSYTYTAFAFPNINDNYPSNNIRINTDTVSGSFDPNVKEVNIRNLPLNYDANTQLEYVIHFQNTGTDTAFTILVRDTLSNFLDVPSLQVINTSHSYQLQLREQNIVEVFFPNILLPDSNANEPLSHGFVQFSVKPKAGLPVNTTISNQADIYFDYNEAVKTNTAQTTITVLGIRNVITDWGKLSISPNPTTELLTIQYDTKREKAELTWFDVYGREIHSQIIQGQGSTSFSLNNFAAGVYLYRLTTKNTLLTSGRVMKTK